VSRPNPALIPAAFAVVVMSMLVSARAWAMDDFSGTRALGMGDEEIIDLLHAVAIFGWANRLMQTLGEPAAPATAGNPL